MTKERNRLKDTMSEAFDEFMETTEREEQIDTSLRFTTGTISPQAMSPTNAMASTFSASATVVKGSPEKHIPKTLLKPASAEETNHPLKEGLATTPRKTSVSKGSMASKRRSLIQPMMVPKTPETDRTNSVTMGSGVTSSANKNNNSNNNNITNDSSRGHTPKLDNSKFSDAIASTANTSKRNSMHSRTSSTQSMAVDTSLGNGMDVNALLQSLANKELELLECKRKIEDLKKQLQLEETIFQNKNNELQDLKNKVSKNLNGSNKNNNPGNNRLSLSKENSRGTPNDTPVKKLVASGDTRTYEDQSKQSMWSKPLAIFNQVDQIIQHELERTLNWDEPPTPVEEAIEENNADSGGVSQSIWNFVAEVKSGLLGIEEEDEESSKDGSTGQPTQRPSFNNSKSKDKPNNTDDNDLDLSIKEFKTAKKLHEDNEHNNLKKRDVKKSSRKKSSSSGNKLSFIDDNDTTFPESPLVEMGDFSKPATASSP